MNCLLELFFKNSDLDANNFLSTRLLSAIKKYLQIDDILEGVLINNYSTPERVVITIELENIIKYSIKGIKISDKKEHLDYFLKKIKVDNINELSIKDDRYYYEFEKNKEDFIDDFLQNIDKILNDSFSKNYKKLLLSLNNIYLNINNECKDIIFNNIKSSDFIVINNKHHQVNNIENYFNLLKNNNIFLDKKEREDFVRNNLPIINEDFIHNVLFIKEKPLFECGRIKFVCNDLYIEILENITKNKFIFFRKDEFLYFIFLSDNGTENIKDFENNYTENCNYLNIEKIIHKTNNKIKTYDKNKKSKEYKFIFNENRLNRLSKITKFLSIWVPNCNMEEVDTILYSPVYKNSDFLDNNTNLDLLIKKYFLIENNKNEVFIETIIDSLKPIKNGNDLPTIPTAIAISISNKIDSIIYLSILLELKKNINKNLEKEVYNSLLKIILENNIDIPLRILLNYAIKNFINETIKKKQNRSIIKKYKINKDLVVNEILEKIYNKMYYYLINNDNLKEDNVNILMNSEIYKINTRKGCHILNIYNKVKIICKYLESNDINYLISTYKRINNLLNKKAKIINKLNIVFKPRKFNNFYEKNIYSKYFQLKKDYRKINNKIDYEVIMYDFFELSKSVNDFLNNVYINKTNIFKRKKYIKLILLIRKIFNRLMNFDSFN